MAASRIAIFDDAYLCGDTLTHGVGVADHAHFFALRGLQHGQRVDDGDQRVLIERSEALINEKVLE